MYTIFLTLHLTHNFYYLVSMEKFKAEYYFKIGLHLKTFIEFSYYL